MINNILQVTTLDSQEITVVIIWLWTCSDKRVITCLKEKINDIDVEEGVSQRMDIGYKFKGMFFKIMALYARPYYLSFHSPQCHPSKQYDVVTMLWQSCS